jgi:hypothetical protein
MGSLLTYEVQFLSPVPTRPVTARTIAKRPQIPVRPTPFRSTMTKGPARRERRFLAFVAEAVWIVLLALMLVVGTRVMYAFVVLQVPPPAVHVNETVTAGGPPSGGAPQGVP